MSDEAEQRAKVEPMGALVGKWALGDPAAPVGRTTFEWLEGGFFLVQRWTIDVPGAPDGIAILGVDPDSGGLVQHFFDSRGVARVYRMTLEGDTWKLWRDAPGFFQRFAATFSADGNTIRGAWELSDDGEEWEHDFELVYTRVNH